MKCFVCQKEIIKRIEPNKLRRNKRHFCSRKCYQIQWGLDRTGEKNVRWNPLNERLCKFCSKQFHRTGRYGKPAKYCSMGCKAKDQVESFSGANNHRWKGGISSLGDKIRHSEEYIAWRNTCGKRDKFKCQFCGASHSKRLVIHHIKTFEKYPSLRFEVSNGITLCRACHMKLHAENRGVHDFTKILNDYMPNIKSKDL